MLSLNHNLTVILTRNRLVLLTLMLLGSSFIPGDGLMGFVLGF